MRKRWATLTIAFGMLLGFCGQSIAYDPNNCSTIEGNALHLCERQEVHGDIVDLTALQAQFDAVGRDLPNKYLLVEAIQGGTASVDYLVLIHNILPYPQYQRVTTTITYDGTWHLTVAEEIGINAFRVVIMGFMLLFAGYAAVVGPISLKLSEMSTCILAGVVVGLLILAAILGTEWGGLIAILILGLLFLAGVTREPILITWLVALATGFVAYSFKTTGNLEILVEWVIFCLFCVVLQYIFYFLMKLKRKTKPQNA